jgi:P pilus assembly chaperone PapD
MKKLKFQIFGALALTITNFSSDAGILAERTRVIYPENKREVSLMLNNTNPYAVMTQIWIDQGLGDPDKTQAPFMVLAPIFKLQPQESKGIRVIMTPNHNLPKDKESLFWVNLYEIPSVQAKSMDKNYVNMSMNTQIKLIYRPQHIVALDVEQLYKQLIISHQYAEDTLKLEIRNPSVHYVSMAQLAIYLDGKVVKAEETELMLSPEGSQRYTFNGVRASQSQELQLILIDDQGQHYPFKHPL